MEPDVSVRSPAEKNAPWTDLQVAILRTLLYGDVFSFPMTAAEIHHFLIHKQPVALDDVVAALTSPPLASVLESADGYYACAGRGDIIPLRVAREQSSRDLLPLAIRYGAWLARLPFVRMVALTGALAMRNATHARDDLDYLLVTAPGRVWLARAFSIALVRLAKLRGVVICPNYVLAETALVQERQDLFIAHEVVQMLPLYGQELYAKLRAMNGWVAAHLPNAAGPFYALEQHRPAGLWRALKQALESALGGRLGDALEHWECRRKLRRFAADMNTPHSAAQLDGERVKGHFYDHGHRVLAAYVERLRAYGLEAGTVTGSPNGSTGASE